MLNTLRLLLPALIPSWNFFDVIGPSPRIEYALSAAPDAEPGGWAEFRPRPDRLSPATMAGRLFWNPRWNETLFLVSLAERLIREPSEHSEEEIFRRIAADLAGDRRGAWLSFRLVFTGREGEETFREVLFRAEPRLLAGIAAP